MTVRAETALVNFAAGELSPRMRGRYDLPVFLTGCKRLQNFISETAGAARFRNGFRYVRTTRRNKKANFIPFQFNDEQAYLLEFTDGYMRVYKDEGIVLHTALNITGITAANPGVVTSNAHGYSNGDEVFITGVVGMTEVNDKYYLVAGVTANTFQLTDQDGNNVNTTGYTAYSSGGTCAKVFELATPYTEANDLFVLDFTQNADTMYIVHPEYSPRKLTRSSHTSWTIASFTRTTDAFGQKLITGITQANPAVVTSASHGFSNGDILAIDGVVGMTQVNNLQFTIANVTANTFELQGIDSTAYTAYSSGGYATLATKLPQAVGFYEGRLGYACTDANPQGFWLSRAPSSVGATRYDDFTTGTNADDSVAYSIATPDGEVNKIFWIAGTDRFLALGTFGGIVRADGGSDDDAITPTNIRVRPLDSEGCANILPILRQNTILYIQRGKQTMRTLEFDALADGFISIDRNLIADHVGKNNFKQLVFQAGRPDLMWGVMDDGELYGLTIKSREDVSGWHRHQTKKKEHKFLWLGVMPRVTSSEQLWAVVERSINGSTRRYVEFMEDEISAPELIDYFTEKANKATDKAKFLLDMFEAQKGYVHVDSALTYDGRDPGLDAGASVTPAAVTGTSVIFTASASVFKSTDVGRQIWKKAISGVGEGRAEITGYTSGTQVTCKILKDFNNASAMGAGNWYLTTATVQGLEHLQAEEVTVVTDGSVHPKETVASGQISLDYQAGMVHVGIGYQGILQTMNLEIGGITTAQTKKKSIYALGIRFLASLGAYYGTDLYNMDQIQFRSTGDAINRPPPLFSGDKTLPVTDSWEEEKTVYVQQQQPLPCTVQMLIPYGLTSN